VDDVQTEIIAEEKRKQDPGSKVLEATRMAPISWIGPVTLDVELPILMVRLASLRAKAMSVGRQGMRGADVRAKQPSTGS
jgi:hypothetical protein